MPKRSFEEFGAVIAQYQAPPTPDMLQDLVVETIEIDRNDIDEPVVVFARGRIDLAYRTGQIDTHLRHLYDVLGVLEREMAEQS